MIAGNTSILLNGFGWIIFREDLVSFHVAELQNDRKKLYHPMNPDDKRGAFLIDSAEWIPMELAL